MAENDNKSIRLMKSEISTLTPLEKEVIGSIVRGHGNLPDKMEGEEYDKLLQEVIDAEVRVKNLKPISDRQREILIEDSKRYKGGIEEFAKELHVDADFLKASLIEHKYKPYTITIGTDNRPGGVDGEYHLQFKPDIMNVTFGEQEKVAKEYGGTMRVTDGQEWADFYHEADAVKFAEKVVGMNQERDLVGRYYSAGMGNGTQFWTDRGTLGAYQAYAFKDNKILVFKDADDSKGVLLSSLSHEEQKYIMDSIGSLLDRHLITQERNFAEAREHLMSVLDSARSDLGDTILIKPTPVKLAGSAFAKATGVYLAPDGNGGGEYRLLGSYSDALAVEMNGHTEFNVCKILDAVASINGLAKAVHDVHVNHLEQGAKQAIRDRIVTPSARSFTPDQVEVLNHYHQVAAPDKPAGEVFKELLDEVAQEPDVARKPEKWVTDTAKELDDLAEDITRDQSRGIHI